MDDIDPAELSRQLKKPNGRLGREVAQKLNESNQQLYELAWETVDFGSTEQILEIGFGNGKHLSRYIDFNPNLTVTGVDFSEEMCEEARATHPELIERGQLAIYCTDSSDIPADDNFFDVIIGLNVLYFWDPPELHLKEIGRVLRPGGKLLLGYRPRHAVEHLGFTKQNFILYEPKELKTLISDNGLTVTRHEIRTYSKQAPDGSENEITDICLVADRT